MTIWAGDYERVLQDNRNERIILVGGGLYSGACEAPYDNVERLYFPYFQSIFFLIFSWDDNVERFVYVKTSS